MGVDLSLPVLWRDERGDALAGRVDLTRAGLHLDGGSRDGRRSRDIAFSEITGVRIGRSRVERMNGRQALVLELRGGASVSIAGFDRLGTLHDLVERLQRETGFTP